MGRTVRRHRGGKMVSKGAYGCGFIPALMCEGNAERDPDGFSKLMRRRNADKEWEERDIISKIDPHYQYSVYPSRKCTFSLNKMGEQNDIESCGKQFLFNLKEGTFEDDIKTKYAVLQMPMGGTALSNLQLNKRNAPHILQGFKQLLNGLIFMHANSFYHLDIKPDNIVAMKRPDNSYNFRYIDFGLSRTSQALAEKDEPFPFIGDYLYWPFEFKYLIMRFALPSPDTPEFLIALTNHLNNYYSIALQEKTRKTNPNWYNGLIYIPEGVHYNSSSQRLINPEMYLEVYRKFKKSVETKGLKEALDEILEKVDAYSFGIVLAYVITFSMGAISRHNSVYILGPNGISDPATRKIMDPGHEASYELLFSIVRGLMHYDPYQRLTVREALIRYKEALKFFIYDEKIAKYNAKQHPVSLAPSLKMEEGAQKRKRSPELSPIPSVSSPGTQNNRTRKRPRLQGGKLVGQGSYGCGFIPALQCSDEDQREEGTFTKLIATDDAKIEMSMVEHIREIDPDQVFSLYPRTMCFPNASKITPEDALRQCKAKIFRGRNPEKSIELLTSGQISLLQTPIGGDDLIHLKVPKENLGQFLASFQNILRGLHKMHSKGLYHLDIKPDNILSMEQDGRYTTRFIDFGLSRTAEELIEDKEYPINADYEIWPYEFRIFEHMNNMEMLGSKFIDILYNKNHLNVFNDLPNLYLKKSPISTDGSLHIPSGVYFNKGHLTEDDNYFRHVFYQIASNIQTDGITALKKYLEKVDVFSMGACMAWVFTKQTGYFYKFGRVHYLDNKKQMKPVFNDEVVQFVGGFFQLIRKMMDPNPHQRLTARSALMEFQEYLESIKNIHGISAQPIDIIDTESLFESELRVFSSNPRSVIADLGGSPLDVERLLNNSLQQVSPNSNSNNLVNRIQKIRMQVANEDGKIYEVDSIHSNNSYY